ncbi:hypothetical protein Rhopal_001278-T1 [Rhodotorula paludigena]|uniref:DUF7918 domain-containing protein n=1 Tax=Rhodotorula paludigena TaxID=86838 RepID=A0AAV5GI43_9BASI|nr:hypothetical protein Rhopal_001278-T1 [Rhodotorula paludigena]
MPAKGPYAPAPRAKRPPVNAAPAEIVAPISLRRNKPAGTSSAASPASPAAKGKARDPTQGGTDAGPSRHATAAGKPAKEALTQAKTKNPPVAVFRQKPAFTAPSAASAPREDKGKRASNDGQGAPPSLLDRLGPPPAERTASASGAQAQADERACEQRRQDGGAWRGGSSGRGRGRGGHRGGYAGARGPKTRVSDKLLCLGDVTSWILVDNKAVPLYKPKPDGPMKMTCHIEAIEGSEFAIGFRDERPLDAEAPDFLCEVVVDGIVCSADRQIIRSWKKEKQWREREVASRRAFTWRGRSESATTLRPFKFSTLALTSEQDEASPLSESAFKALGSIQLRIYRGRVGAPHTNAAAMSAGDADGSSVGIGELRIWEESKKAAMGLSHQASLGPPQLRAPEPRSTFQFDEQRWGDGPDKPYIVMEFKYRSRLVLELEGFVEARDDSTPPVASGSNSASSTHASSASTAAAPAERRTTRATSSAKPKLKRPRSSSPDLIRARSPSSEPPAPSPPARATKVKREEKEKGKGRAAGQPKALGELVLVDDSSSDDAEESGGRSSRRALKVERSTPAKPSLAAALSSSGKKGKARAAAADDSDADADAEIARLRAELAEYKRRELEQLRRETEAARRRDEVRRVLEARKERAVQHKEQKKEKEKEKKRAREVVADQDEDEDEAREVQGLLVVGGEGARNEAKKRKKAVKREGDVLVLSDGSDSE